MKDDRYKTLRPRIYNPTERRYDTFVDDEIIILPPLVDDGSINLSPLIPEDNTLLNEEGKKTKFQKEIDEILREYLAKR